MKLYLGYAAGVGKTYACLQEAHRLREGGIDVVLGYVEPHRREDTRRLVGGLEQVPLVPAAGEYPAELNVAAVIERNPTVVIIDELAHSRPQGADGTAAGVTRRPEARSFKMIPMRSTGVISPANSGRLSTSAYSPKMAGV